MSEIPKAYEPQSVEDKWYDFWLKHGCFTADPSRVSEKRPAYSIVIPPPNVTGMLHMGHVLNNTIQDILARKARMDGKEVLWLPGTDHAGIATQVQVEKALKKEERLTKYGLGREKFLERVWAWKEKHGGIIIQQLKKLGCSCDWTRERFTMDPEYSRCVQKVFVELYKKGLIYRGKRMVNWCPATQTALSDEEVEMKPQKGFMYHFKVEVVDATPSSHGKVAATPPSPTHPASGGARSTPGDEGVTSTSIWLTIATTRPETIPGDTAVAVNPKDPRYAHLIGKHIVRPLPPELPREQKLIPIIGDEHVDFEFGTGVLKVTPAHDKADFDIGQRHKLPIVDIMNPDASMNDLAGVDLKGLDRFKARKVAVEKLKELEAFVDEKPYENNVGFSQRADVPIEPRLSEQWFLKYPAVEQSKVCVEQDDDSVGRASSRAANAQDGSSVASPHQKMRFHPQRWAKVYDHWLTNIQDWCISRQLWWGHRIPVWTKSFEVVPDKAHELGYTAGAPTLQSDPDTVVQVEVNGKLLPASDPFTGLKAGDQVTVRIATTNLKFQEPLEKNGFTQDPDVLDTWFSSWLWPFATMGWPEQTETLKKFYPTTDLVTAPEIIFFWVARMIMAGFEYMGELPFHNVHFTGIVRDKQGRKMSKSLGNSPDPLELIAKYGADAIRFGTMRSAPLGQDVMFDEKDVELGRNFCNKLWNACRFRQMVGGGDASSPNRAASDGGVAATYEVQGEIERTLLSPDDKWILLKLDGTIREVSIALNEYKFSEATAALYRFFWNEYCDWYVEASKAVLSCRSRGDETQTEKAESDQSLLTSAPTSRDEARRANTIAVIDFVLSHTLRLFHPFLPFITEELWHGMGYSTDMPENQGGKTIMTAPWPMPFDEDFLGHYGLDSCYLDMVNGKYDLVTQGRNLRRAGNIQAGKKVKYVFKPAQHLMPHDAEVIKLLLNAESLEVNPDYQPPKGTPTVRTELGELLLPLEGHIDPAAEKIRLTKEKEKTEAEIVKVEQKLANPNFTSKVPPQVLAEHQQRLIEWQAKLEHLKNALAALG
jgi:valyl-tRNA synthetase